MNQNTAPDPRRWLALAVILSATLLGVLDFLIVNIAVPSIRTDIGATDAEVQLTVAGYGLAYAVCLITGGRLGDIYGRKRMFLIGMGGFTLASALCGWAQTPTQLVLFRVVQGLLASLMSPQVLAIIQVTFQGRERDTATGAMGAVVGIGSFVGNVLGGWLVGANIFGLGWRPIFFVNVPIGIIAMVCAWFLVRESKAERAQKLDVPGALLCGITLFCFIFPLAEGRERGWPWWAWAMLLFSGVLACAFFAFEKRVAQSGGSPLVDLTLFKRREFSLGLGAILLMFAAMGSFVLTLTLFLQNGLGQTPARTGVLSSPLAVSFFFASMFAVKLSQRIGPRILSVGLAIAILGQLMLLALALWFRGGFNPLWVVPALFIYGIGQGLTVPRLIRTTLTTVPVENAGAASGVLSTTQQIAFTIGISVVGTIFFGILSQSKQPSPDLYAHAWAAALACNTACFAFTLPLVARFAKSPSEPANNSVAVEAT